MTLVFRVNYCTRFGQSLWLVVKELATDGQVTEQVLPLRWINAEQWQVEYELADERVNRVEYGYQLREEGNDLQLGEWGEARVWQVDWICQRAVLLRDTWRSAGTHDYVFETKAFDALLPERGPFAADVVPDGATHTFGIHVAAVPDGQQLCLCGDANELGAWDWRAALRLEEVASNQWCAHARLPTGRALRYKYGWIDRATGEVVAIEAGQDRVLEADDAVFTRVLDEAFRRDADALFRGAGVVLPVFSLRSDDGLGVGEFADLKRLADWCRDVGLGMIQILPINDTSSAGDWTDSYPYSAISVFALHPIYLRIDALDYPMPPEFGIELAAHRKSLNCRDQLDYEAVMRVKRQFTHEVFARHAATIMGDPGFNCFLAGERDWLMPYAAFCLLRDRFGTADFSQWGDWAAFDPGRVEGLMDDGEAREQMLYHLWLQYELDRQLCDAVAHLHDCGVVLKGDLPIGIDRQSADAWSAPHLFKLDAQAGAPPDAFAVKGQNWGFPTYDWERMREDGYVWWQARFAHLSRYFDAFRIDHILGFFRIWQVPMDQVEGIMGWFDPAQPVRLDEFRERKIAFDFDRFCRPFITPEVVAERFGDDAGEVIEQFLLVDKDGCFRLRDEVANQRRVVDQFAKLLAADDCQPSKLMRIRQGLMDCVAEVLFFEVPGSGGREFHPRFFMQKTASFEALDELVKERVDALYIDYFFRRQDFHWKARGYEKLPAMRRASRMLLCGEDLGLVPECVPEVLQELGILSLEIQRMPKTAHAEFGDPAAAPYLSVVSPSTHDMATLRAWWEEDPRVTARFAWRAFGEAKPDHPLGADMAGRIIEQHFASPAMWAVVSLQDMLAMDESLRHPDLEAERINVPAVMPYYWRYRMHLGLDDLQQADRLSGKIRELLVSSGRSGSSVA